MGSGWDHIKNLAAIISQYKMTKKFATEILYKYENTPAGQVKLKIDINTIPAQWIKPIFVKIVDPSKLKIALKTVFST